MRKLLVLEMNEIPYRLLDEYLRRPGFEALKTFFGEARQLTSVSNDTGELSPWVTWPSLHRGLDNTSHGVKNLGQDPGTFKGTPIWEEYREAGHAVGVCGALQSWPPRDPGADGFYVPDTFAADARCIPQRIEGIQRFNLSQVKANGRVVSASLGVSLRALPKILADIHSAGVRLGTLAKVALHVVRERFNPKLRARRPILQTVLYWDVFKSLYDPTRAPAYTSFFTNHVASVMHRYWNHAFPEDFPEEQRPKQASHRATFDYAMKLADDMVAQTLEWQRREPELVVVFASSMGQGPVYRKGHGKQLILKDLGKLLSRLGASEGTYEPRLAMVPQFAFIMPDPVLRARTIAALSAFRTASGNPLFKVQEIESSVSLTLAAPDLSSLQAKGVKDGKGAEVTWEDLGLVCVDVEKGTGYHIPEGIFALKGRGIEPSKARERIPLARVKGELMTVAGFETSLRLEDQARASFASLSPDSKAPSNDVSGGLAPGEASLQIDERALGALEEGVRPRTPILR